MKFRFASPHLQAGMRYMNAAGDEGSHDGMSPGSDQSGESGDKGSADKSDGDKDGISENEAKLLKESMARKAKIKELDAQNAELASKLEEVNKSLEKFKDIDVEQYQNLLADKAKAEEDALKSAGDWEKLQERMAQEHSREKEQMIAANQEALLAKENEVSEYKSQIDALSAQINELTVGTAFSNSQFVQDKLIPSPSKVRKLYDEHFDAVDGKVVAYDKPRGAEDRTMLVNGEGKPLSFEDALTRIVDADPDRDSILRSEMKPGANSSTDGSSTKPGPKIGKGIDRIAYAMNKSSQSKS